MNKILKAKIFEKFGTQWDFARAIGAHEVVISRVVQERRPLKMAEQQRWATALDMEITKLFPAGQ